MNWKQTTIVAAIMILMASCNSNSNSTASASNTADAIYFGGDIITMEGDSATYAEAVAIKDGKIVKTIDRSLLRRALTPQCFRYSILRKAFEKVKDLSESATDESYLVEKIGVDVSIVEGTARNIKVTTKEDLQLVETL